MGNWVEAESAKQEVGRTLLVIVIWVAGTLGLLASDHGARLWSWEGARFLVALVAMLYLACLAFLSVTERLGRDKGRSRKQALVSTVFGIPAALSMGDGYAAFLMFLLLGFPLDFWGVAKR